MARATVGKVPPAGVVVVLLTGGVVVVLEVGGVVVDEVGGVVVVEVVAVVEDLLQPATISTTADREATMNIKDFVFIVLSPFVFARLSQPYILFRKVKPPSILALHFPQVKISKKGERHGCRSPSTTESALMLLGRGSRVASALGADIGGAPGVIGW